MQQQLLLCFCCGSLIVNRRKELFTPIETHELLKLHEKLDTLTKALHNLNLKSQVFVVDLRLHEVQAEEIKSEILETLANIDRLYGLN